MLQVIDSLEELENLRPEWLALWRDCPRATPFQSPQWLLPWIRHLFGGGEIVALALRESGKLIGFAPFFRWGLEDRKVISFLGAGISDYGDLLFAAGREPECVSAATAFLAKDDLDLQELRENSGLLKAWRAEPCSVCPVLQLETFPNSMNDKHRTDVRRARNKLAKDPELRITLANEATLHADMNHFLGLYEARWGAPNETLRRFHEDASIAFLETGNLRLALLRTVIGPAAAVYAFTSGKTLYCYLSGFDPLQAKQSPGAVLLGWLIDHAIAEGLDQVDFLRDGEAYKYLWGARDRTNYAVRRQRTS